jgi:hypothetical protein
MPLRLAGALRDPSLALALLVLSACGDKCEALCGDVADRIGTCRPESITWADLGATSRQNFENECERAWDRTRLDLSANDLRLALDDCQAASQEINTLSCDELIALYGPAR